METTRSASKKRALAVVADDDNDPPSSRRRTCDQSALVPPLTVTTTTSNTNASEDSLWKLQVESVTAELDHERSLREMDAKRFQQVQRRLESQVQFALDEAQEAKDMAADWRSQSESHIAQLREARTEALQQLRDCQKRLETAETKLLQQNSVMQHQQSTQRLQAELQARVDEVEALKRTLHELEHHMADLQQQNRDAQQDDATKEVMGASAAPEAVLRELNRVRVRKAELERQNRQLERRNAELTKTAKLLMPQQEKASVATKRVEQLETELRELRQRHEATLASQSSWKDFQKNLSKALGKTSDGGPPEVATVLRRLEATNQRSEQAEQNNKALNAQLEKCQDRVMSLEQKLKTAETLESTWNKEKKNLERDVERAMQQVKTVLAQEDIWKREANSLRSLLNATDKIQASSSGSSSQTKIQSLELSVSSLRKELELVKTDRNKIWKELQEVTIQRKTDQTEHARVLEKFGKLREAVHAERAKAERAEERMQKAEALAGKGAFNPEHTRVLHLKQNPLTQTLQDQVQTLKRQLEEMKQANPKAAATGPEVNPDKLHQRLKESFKEQIGLFREGVYLMTGFKIDMLPQGDRPSFRVRSVFAEQEKDHLMLQWPKAGKEVRSLDLMDTELAQILATTPSYEYMTKFGSLPAFLASVQLSLFEKQTFMG